MLAQKRLLNKQRPIRLQRLSKLLRHGFMQPPMKVQRRIHTLRLDRLQSLDRRLEHLRRVQPAHILGRVHLHGLEPLGQTRLGGALDVGGPVAADPGVDGYAVAHFAAQ